MGEMTDAERAAEWLTQNRLGDVFRVQVPMWELRVPRGDGYYRSRMLSDAELIQYARELRMPEDAHTT